MASFYGNTDGHELPVPMVPGFLRGYRAWLPRIYSIADGGGPFLESTTFRGNVLRPGVNQSACLVSLCAETAELAHPSPAQFCDCGYYAVFSSVLEEVAMAVAESSGIHSHHLIFGSVKATGRVFFGEKGFRAERIEVEALAAPPMTGGLSFLSFSEVQRNCRSYAPTYNVPFFNSFEELARVFPPPDLSHLRKTEVTQ